MRDLCRTIHGIRVLICSQHGRLLKNGRDANIFLSAAWSQRAALIAIPTARVDPDFFSLSSFVAGEVIQKFVNYQVRLALVGDISGLREKSRSFRDFVTEANKGQAVWFVSDLHELEGRLAARP